MRRRFVVDATMRRRAKDAAAERARRDAKKGWVLWDVQVRFRVAPGAQDLDDVRVTADATYRAADDRRDGRGRQRPLQSGRRTYRLSELIDPSPNAFRQPVDPLTPAERGAELDDRTKREIARSLARGTLPDDKREELALDRIVNVRRQAATAKSLPRIKSLLDELTKAAALSNSGEVTSATQQTMAVLRTNVEEQIAQRRKEERERTRADDPWAIPHPNRTSFLRDAERLRLMLGG